MRYLSFIIISVSFNCWSADFKELSDAELSRKAISVIKDAEIDKQLGEVSIFRECRDKNRFDAREKNQATIDSKLKAAVDCFRKKIGSGTDEKKLLEMAEKLNLQSYGLIQSKNLKDITKFLSDKMYKAMTGVDRKSGDIAATIEAMKFKNKRMLDQKDFIDLYMTQLGKNALYEISRFCFEDFRMKPAVGAVVPEYSDFSSHWSAFLSSGIEPANTELTDSGEPNFFKLTTTNKDGIYKEISEGISSEKMNTAMLSKFFNFCGKSILKICTEFEKVDRQNDTQVTLVNDKMSLGARACLTKARLQEYRTAISKTEKVAAQFDTMSGSEVALTLDAGAAPVKYYDRGKSNEKESIDNLTNYASTDILEGGLDKSSKIDQLKEDCLESPDRSDCQDYLVIDDSLDKTGHSLTMELKLKKEIALERVRRAKAISKESVSEYLTAQGYLDLLERYNASPNRNSFDLEDEITKIFEAKRVASLEGLKLKLGKRQVSEKASKDPGFDKGAESIQENITVVQEERARLAQVVLFNNIITSHLSLYQGAKGKEKLIGQNINAWKVEEQGRSGKSSNIEPELFKNLKKEARDAPAGPNTSDNSIVGLGMLDTILGKASN